MRFSNIFSLVPLLLTGQTVLAVPAASREAAPGPAPEPLPEGSFEITEADGTKRLAKRGDRIELVNCRFSNPNGSGWRSSVITNEIYGVKYCPNSAPGGGCGVEPVDPSNVCIMKDSKIQDDYHTWEGGDQSCRFASSGTTFRWNIARSAQSQPNYSEVGPGSNNWRGFMGYKGDKSYQKVNVYFWSCSEIYYYL